MCLHFDELVSYIYTLTGERGGGCKSGQKASKSLEAKETQEEMQEGRISQYTFLSCSNVLVIFDLYMTHLSFLLDEQQKSF